VSDFEMFGEDPNNEDKLVPELRACVSVRNGFRMVHHPLLVELGVLWKPQNERFARKKEQAAAAFAGKDWAHYLWLHERPYRLPMLRQLWLAKTIDRATLRNLLPKFWSDSEPNDADPRWLTLWRQAAKEGTVVSEGAMLPSSIDRIYRGGAKPGDWKGIAWTTSYDTAMFFALRFRAVGVIFTGRVSTADVLGYVTDRGENEVIVDPRKVLDITSASVVGKRPEQAVVVDLVP
jgi:hypothetical protein